MPKNSAAKFYQKKSRKTTKNACERYQNLYKEQKEKVTIWSRMLWKPLIK